MGQREIGTVEPADTVREQLEKIVSDKGYTNPQVDMRVNTGRVEIRVVGYMGGRWYTCSVPAKDYASAPDALEKAIINNKMVMLGGSQ